MTVITFYNAKGGVGKTTSACAVASSLAVNHNFKVCCIDLDLTQNSLSQIFVAEGQQARRSVMDALLGQATLPDVILRSNVLEKAKSFGDIDRFHIYVCPCLPYAEESTMSLDSFPHREYTLKKLLENPLIAEEFDFVIIDCPPALNALTKNALVASDGVLVPYRNDAFSYIGISTMLDESIAVKQRYNPNLQFLGVFFTQDKKNVRLHATIKEQLERDLQDNFMSTTIPDSITVAESTFAGLPANIYKPWSPVDICYRALTGELMQRLGIETKSQLAPAKKEARRKS